MRGVSVDSEMIHHNSPADNEDEERGTKHIELHFVNSLIAMESHLQLYSKIQFYDM